MIVCYKFLTRMPQCRTWQALPFFCPKGAPGTHFQLVPLGSPKGISWANFHP